MTLKRLENVVSLWLESSCIRVLTLGDWPKIVLKLRPSTAGKKIITIFPIFLSCLKVIDRSFQFLWYKGKKEKYLNNYFFKSCGTHRILQMREKGLVFKWLNHFQSKLHQCIDQLENHKNQKKARPNLQLSLNNFSGAFALLGTGSFLSVIVLIAEKIYASYAIVSRR